MKFHLTDVFGKSAYSGNQLATFLGCAGLTDNEMQKIAREINFSKTTFVLTDDPAANKYQVRLFTPGEEIAFAGHPTLGTAYVIQKHVIRRPVPEIVLDLGIGLVPVSFPETETSSAPLLWMRQPEAEVGETFERGVIASVLGIEENDVADEWPVMAVSTGLPHIVVPLTSRQALAKIRISDSHYAELVATASAKSLAVFSTEPHEPGQAIAVRVFAPYYGVYEDPATGSGNGCIAAYIVNQRLFGAEKFDIRSGQGYEMGRPSELSWRAESQGSGISVLVGGSVISIASGEWPAHER